ncbi:MAG TPA: hypothetical protein VLX92_18385 [Kofleriaceae bacterium]|nr:hypothetical protein [Kofleriaceae bacterium]
MIDPLGHVVALARSWRGRFILVFVAIQLALPLTYYVGRRDPHDERFAWRMFSPMRMARCTPRFTLDGKPLALTSEFHEAWIEIAERGRFHVIEAMAARVCARHPGSAVVVTLDCTYLDRPPAQYGGYDMCQVPRL